MIYFDGIIYNIQKFGGISVYYNEILSFFSNENICYDLFVEKPMIGLATPNCKIIELESNFFSIKVSRLLDVKISTEYDIFHSTYYRLPKKKSNVKIVTTVHDFTTEIYGKGLRRLIHRLQKKRAVLASDVIVCISENTKQDLLKYIPESKNKRIEVIYNGVSSAYYVESFENSPYSTQKYSLFVGARSDYKNFYKAVFALKDMEGFSLFIVGGGELTKNELSMIKELLGSRYRYFGFVSNSLLRQLYNQAHCLIYPSDYEGFGIPVVEAMKCGCPVILGANSSLVEIAQGSSLFYSDDIEGMLISDLITRLNDTDFRCVEVEKGFSFSTKFSWKITADKYVWLYRTLGTNVNEGGG